MNKDRIVSIRMDEGTYRRLKSLADHSGASLSETIRRHLTPPAVHTFVKPPWHTGSSTSTYPTPATITYTAWNAA